MSEQNEEWRPIAGFEGLYEVSDHGRVRSFDRVSPKGRRMPGKYLSIADRAWPMVNLMDSAGGHTIRTVHRLVAETFVAGREPGLEVCHNNGIPNDNRASNLRWGTRSDNLRDAVSHGVHGMARKTHCIRGHEFTAENTAGKDGKRICKTCMKAHRRAWRDRLSPERKAEINERERVRMNAKYRAQHGLPTEA